MQSLSVRRFEMGLPLFAGLNLGALLEAQSRLEKGEYAGLTDWVTSLGKTGETRTIRKLAAIWTATDLELQQAELDPKFMTKLEEQVASKPFLDAFKDATNFQEALFNTLGIIPVSSETMPMKTEEQPQSDSSSDASSAQ